MLCWSLFVLLYFFVWPVCSLILIAPLVSSNTSYIVAVSLIGGGNWKKHRPLPLVLVDTGCCNPPTKRSRPPRPLMQKDPLDWLLFKVKFENIYTSINYFCSCCTYIVFAPKRFGAGTAYPSGAPAITPGLQWGSCYSIFSCMCMFCRSLFVLFL